MSLPPNQLGLVYGRSGAGKTTLLQLVAGLAQQTAGSIGFSGPPAGTNGAAAGASSSGELTAEERMAQVGAALQGWVRWWAAWQASAGPELEHLIF